MMISDYVDVFESVACNDIKAGVAAVVEAVIDHLHDDVLAWCDDLIEGRDELINYSVSIKKTSEKPLRAE